MSIQRNLNYHKLFTLICFAFLIVGCGKSRVMSEQEAIALATQEVAKRDGWMDTEPLLLNKDRSNEFLVSIWLKPAIPGLVRYVWIKNGKVVKYEPGE
jgi:hypothetical protein